MITLADIKRAVSLAKKHATGTIYVNGQRQYVFVRGKGFVEPGRYKAKLRGKGR